MDEKISQNKESRDWMTKQGWKYSPFTFSIYPGMMVGYSEQAEMALSAIQLGHKVVLITGPTGSGKTTFMKWLSNQLPTYDFLYLSKPPENPEDFVTLFNSRYKKGFIFKKKAKTLYDLPDFLNSSLKKPLILLCDEAHEATDEVLEWLRTLTDNIYSMTLVLAALPVFEQHLSSRLETLRKRISIRISLLSLTKEETKELIRRRIEAAGGSGLPFSVEMLDYIYTRSAGFPREVLRICETAVQRASQLGLSMIMPDIFRESEPIEPLATSQTELERLPRKQRQVLEALTQPSTPGQIADYIMSVDAQAYQSHSHALRAINNILKRLQNQGFVDRTQQDKTYLYSLSAKIKTLFVKR